MRAKQSGIFLIDKPVGLTSREALQQIQKKLAVRSLGHTGTLDPLASGLLMALYGHAKKLQEMFTGHDKTYLVNVQLGATSETDDREGELTSKPQLQAPSLAEVKECLAVFQGTIEQKPPKYSAVRVRGKRAYHLAREGSKFELPSRTVQIKQLYIMQYHYPSLVLQVTCSAGTYIRSLARDIGERLATGGYVEQLRRLQVGHWSVGDAKTPGQIVQKDALSLEEFLQNYSKIELPEQSWEKLRHGQAVFYPKEVTEDSFIWIKKTVVGLARRVGEDKISLRKLLVPQDAQLMNFVKQS